MSENVTETVLLWQGLSHTLSEKSAIQKHENPQYTHTYKMHILWIRLQIIYTTHVH